ncbi:hypothetical protein [Kitasatospora sp. NPDC051914]|uniref:hypothetical protein n=1 Tax=Kitasatospora sp. NPDC051914 TaxID=3154945 RepID=UPI00344922AC
MTTETPSTPVPDEPAPPQPAPVLADGASGHADPVDIPESADAPDAASPSGSSAARTPRTARLLLAAVLLGPVLGAGVGYAVQAARPQTPLPPLAVDTLHYPTAPLDPALAAAAEPKPLAIDGDLRKLLVDRPAGAQEWDNNGFGDASGWLRAGDKAMLVGNSEREFRRLMQYHFRRDALLAYRRGDVLYRIELIQFGPDDVGPATLAYTINVPEDGGKIDGTVNGQYEAPKKASHYAESTEQYYYGLATAVRGSVVMRITVFSPNPVDANEIKDLAKRQWERLK